MLNVLLVDHAPVAGGVEMMIRELLTGLDPKDVQPTVVTDIASPMRGRFGPGVAEADIPLPRLKRNPLAGLALLQSARALARVARERQAHVLQTFTARTHLVGALAGRMARVPVVWRLNDETLWRPLALPVGRVPRRIIAVSDYLRQHYRSVLPVTDLIPDGTPLLPPLDQTRARSDLGWPAEAPLVVLVGRLVRWKGHAVLLRALAELAPEFPDLRAMLIGGWSEVDNVPGPLGGGQAYLQELDRLAQRLGVQDRAIFSGHLAKPALAYAAADVVVHTSLRPEPFGRVLIEAMAAERPVVAAAAGGAREIVVPGQTGLLVPPGDPHALAKALRCLLADAALRRRLGSTGRVRAEQEYSLDRMARSFTQVWQEVAA